MAELLLQRISSMVPLGADRGLPFSVRTAAPSDISFVDSLQKRFSNEVGFLPRAALEGHIAKNRIAIGFENDEPAGYILGKAAYQGDPESAILYQCAIEYSAQRHLLGRSLLEHAISLFPRPSKLASAWVAQDIEANFFWEACGFEPIAARRGSKRKGRVHIFWQRRIGGANAATKLRHPTATQGGLMREKRIVLPIEQGRQWKELKPDDFPDAPAPGAPGTPGTGTPGTGTPGPPDPEASSRKSRSGGKAPAEAKLSLDQLRRKFTYGVSEWMWLIINGVGRYLPVVAELEVPQFMDLPGAGVVIGAERSSPPAAALPHSRIPGLGGAKAPPHRLRLGGNNDPQPSRA